jgi:hypothetical protein
MERNQKQHIFRARSEEVQEILSRPPVWIIKWGTSVFFLFLIALLGIAWLIPSPTVVPVKFRLIDRPAFAADKKLQADTAYAAMTSISQNGYGKIAEGQKVTLRLHAFNYQEFGLLHGYVVHVSDQFDDKGMVTVYISLPADHRTSMRRQIQYKNAMTGTGEIIINEKRLIQRFSPF